MELKDKLEEYYRKGKLDPSEKKEFWKLVSEVKIKYGKVPKELADKFGTIKANNRPWKLYSVRSGILLGAITFILGIFSWFWWFFFFLLCFFKTFNTLSFPEVAYTLPHSSADLR